ncbi:HlyC/CorC family transporter [Aquicella lusitana]|uniref:Magnesium and cobalt efflux protein CorC n=1 Tax=Aquicella lusitana TaxID=254246 RepID=A0A370GDX9_9COXI|nr:transporter associated domain-containing protein [Aquicella lusitana]RDI40193.1 magnesium and cobalt transporter [Aquicella lusitana]VVC72416.1 Magnesium and cobalt efflux protein CorC [Aquicella lusitana]
MTDDPDRETYSTKSRTWLERLSALLAHEPKDKEELMEVLRHAEDRHLLSGEMLGMMERIIQVSEMQVREVMVPKAQMVAVQKNSPLTDILPMVIESGHSRFPVFDPAGKDVIGMLLAKDLLKYCFQKNIDQFKMTDMIRPAIFTPQSKRLDILLREFRVNRNHIAIVLDEYGHVAGLVTIEDVLEQIVGEIEDEYDIDEEDGHIKKLDEETYIVKASTLIEEFNEYFRAEFSNEEFDTIGGIVLQGFGHLPKRGENLKLDRFRFKVLHSDHRRIYLLEVKVVKSRKKNSEL